MEINKNYKVDSEKDVGVIINDKLFCADHLAEK